MKRYIWIIILLPILFLWNCETAWDKYFDEKGGENVISSDLNLLEYLKTQDEYSIFLSLLEETGIAKELERDQVLTVWMPSNDIMPEDINQLDSLSKIRLARNHVNNVALYTTKLSGKSSLTTLEGKILSISRSQGKYTIDGNSVIKGDQICQNGVVHGIDGILFPVKNIYEYIEDAGDNYSEFREILFSFNDTIFRPDLSFPLGVDQVGNTIYDSVFVIENYYFNRGDIRNETGSFTFFLPNNEVTIDMMKTVTDYFEGINKEVTAVDSAFMIDWMLRSILHSGKITNYESIRERESVWYEKWRTDKQLVETNYIECSNGYIYNLISLRLPMIKYMEKIVFYPNYLLHLPEDKQPDFFHTYNCIGVSESTWTGDSDAGKPTTLHVDICDNNADAKKAHKDSYIAFKIIERDIYGNLDSVRVMPGIYKLSASYRAWDNNEVTLYINNDSITKFNPGLNRSGQAPRKGKYEYIPLEDAGNEDIERNGLIINNLVVKESYGFNALEIKLVNTGEGYRMTPHYYVLEPTEDNY